MFGGGINLLRYGTSKKCYDARCGLFEWNPKSLEISFSRNPTDSKEDNASNMVATLSKINVVLKGIGHASLIAVSLLRAFVKRSMVVRSVQIFLLRAFGSIKC